MCIALVLFFKRYSKVTGKWHLRAQGSLNQSGCNNETTTRTKVDCCKKTLDKCKDFCKDAKFLEFHEPVSLHDHHCSCFLDCDFSRPASNYGKKASVYESYGMPDLYTFFSSVDIKYDTKLFFLP